MYFISLRLRFDPAKTGFYCDDCFVVRHPSYRLEHSWTKIEGKNITAPYFPLSWVPLTPTCIDSDVNAEQKQWVAHLAR